MINIRKQREEEIIEASKKVFLEKGYYHATMDDIISESSLSKGGVYHYFKNKNDICIHLMNNVSSKRLDLSDKILKKNNNSDILENICDYFFELLVSDSEEIKLASIIFMETRTDQELQNKIHEKFEGRDIKQVSEHVYSIVNIKNRELFERKLLFFFELFHALLYYKYIETINYSDFKEEIKEIFTTLFKDIQIE